MTALLHGQYEHRASQALLCSYLSLSRFSANVHCKTQSFFLKGKSFKYLKVCGSCQFEGLLKLFCLQTCVGLATQTALRGKINLQFDEFHKPLLEPSNKALGFRSESPEGRRVWREMLCNYYVSDRPRPPLPRARPASASGVCTAAGRTCAAPDLIIGDARDCG